jgi:hypothetical protein
MGAQGEQFPKYGKVTGTGSAINVGIPEFTPSKVVLKNVTSGDELEWDCSMPHDYGFKRVAAGTASYVTSGGVTPVSQSVLGDGSDPGRGFTIGTDTDINVAAEVIHWEAWA